jgi:hypothetical protein
MTSLIPGVIRWDAFYTHTSPTSPALKAQDGLSYPAYRGSAPWFAVSTSPYTMNYQATQANIDLEIRVAAQAGFKYWAYVYYYPADTADQDLMYAWSLHRSSSIRNMMNWCPILTLGGLIQNQFSNTAAWQAQMATWVNFFLETYFQKVKTNRPLIYVLWADSDVTAWYSGSVANVATVVTYLNSLCVAAGLGDVYFVVQEGYEPALIADAAADMASAGMTAIGSYANGTFTQGNSAFSVLDTQCQTAWTQWLTEGVPIVPTCMTGWSPQARRERPLSFVNGPPFNGWCNTFTPPTGTQLAAHLQAAINFVEANPTQCDAATFLTYSWTECDEGHNPLVPTQLDPPTQVDPSGSGVLTTQKLVAIGPTLRAVA